MTHLERQLRTIRQFPHHGHLRHILRGVEKESLRITSQGTLALTPHSKALGSALTHPEITTDFSEALLEFITDPHHRVAEVLQQLEDIHRFTYQSLDNEYLWVNSMPCALPPDDEIPVARYGSSNVAKMKTIYRLGLGHRYGRLMQTIAGTHYNFSLPDEFWKQLHAHEQSELSLRDYKTQRYFDLIRNFRRYFWLLLYCFGAAPAVCPTFVEGRKHSLIPLDNNSRTLYAPHATSLRMGDLGYQSKVQESLLINYNSLPDYLTTLCQGITQHHPDYTALGIRNGDGSYNQLNDGILQIENEFYSSVRPKRTTHTGETALRALFERGVEYIEVRCLDLDPYQPLGIDADTMYFLDSFLLYCLLAESPQADDRECRDIQENQQRIVYRGREPGLTLLQRGQEQSFNQWAEDLLADVAQVAQLLDGTMGTDRHGQAVERQRQKVQDADQTPSARILHDLQAQGQSFYDFGLEKAVEYADYFKAEPLTAEQLASFRERARESLAAQEKLEAEEAVGFDEFRDNFYSQYQYCQEEAGCQYGRE